MGADGSYKRSREEFGPIPMDRPEGGDGEPVGELIRVARTTMLMICRRSPGRLSALCLSIFQSKDDPETVSDSNTR